MAWPALLLASGASTDRLYFGTDTRLAELALGAGLAVWWVRRGRHVPDRPIPLTVAAAAAIGLLAVLWATAHPDDRSLYRGGLTLHAVLTLVVILAAIAPRGPVRVVLSFGPLRRLGVISYGAYLFHWPVLLVMQQETSWGPEQRFVLGTAMTIGLAELSYRFVERPIRQGAPAAWRLTWLAVPASVMGRRVRRCRGGVAGACRPAGRLRRGGGRIRRPTCPHCRRAAGLAPAGVGVGAIGDTIRRGRGGGRPDRGRTGPCRPLR